MAHRLIRPVVVTTAMLVLVAIGGGIAVASGIAKTKAATSALACLDAKHAIVMPTNDVCAKGLTPVHLPLSTATGPRGPQGPVGPTGPAGAAGSSGAAGAAGLNSVSGYSQITSTISSVAAGQQSFTIATCPAGETVIGGGGLSDGRSSVVMLASWPISSTQWRVIFQNNSSGSADIWATAMCVTLGS